MRVGVLGGTFDPVHRGHLAMARTALMGLDLGEVRLIPCRRSPHKGDRPLSPGADRLAMIALAVQDEERLVPDSRELGLPEPSFTIDTLRAMTAERPGDRLFFILGADSFQDIRLWKDHDALLAEYHLVVLNRPGCPLPDESGLPAAARGRLMRGSAGADEPDGRVHLLEMDPEHVSSSDIRDRVRSGRALAELVPPAVERYILRGHLYA